MRRQRERNWQQKSQQRVLLEFSSLEQECPDGVYLSLKPGDPSQWSGVLFVRRGPYAAGILRFEITFPPSYPTAPPAIRFTTDIFHPLVTPLTSYTYASGTPRKDAIITGNQECLPPGGFSLKYGFPHWFEDLGQSNVSAQGSSPNASMSSGPRQQSAESRGMPGSSVVQTPDIASQTSCSPAQGQWNPRVASPITSKPPKSVVSVLDYMKRAFDDYQILDSVPLELAGNSGAWKAWQAHRKHMLYILTKKQVVSTSLLGSSGNKGFEDGSSSSEPAVFKKPKQPEEWNWNGVWQDRIHNGINASISGPVLYGLGVGDEPIRFAKTDDDLVQKIKHSALR